MTAISAKGLTFENGGFSLKGIDLQIEQGCVYGLLGASGSGKTTLIHLLNGLLVPSGGECSIMGISPVKEPSRVHSVCGVMTNAAGLYKNMTGWQNLLFFGRMFGIEDKALSHKANQLLKDLGIWEERDKPVRTYSTGVLRRMELARAMVHSPKVLFLDEPGRDLDPYSIQALNTLVANISSDSGTTVFLCAENFAFAQAVCERFGILHKGRIGATGTLEELCAEMDCRVKTRLRLKNCAVLPGFEQNDEWWQTEISSQEQMPSLLHGLLEQGHEIYEARLVRPTLQEVYQAYIERDGGKAE